MFVVRWPWLWRSDIEYETLPLASQQENTRQQTCERQGKFAVNLCMPYNAVDQLFQCYTYMLDSYINEASRPNSSSNPPL
jgi:hypothetical protein